MCNSVASSIFCLRNFDKTKENPVRCGVAVANGTKAAGLVSQHSGLNKAGKIAGKVVNPLIVASCVYQTAKSDDKVGEGTKNAGALSGMMIAERQMKKGKLGKCSAKLTTNIMQKISKSAKVQNTGGKILSGVAFALASIGGWAVGEKAGKTALGMIRDSKTQEDEITTQNESVQNQNFEALA